MWFFLILSLLCAVFAGFVMGWRLGSKREVLSNLIPFFGLEDVSLFEKYAKVKARRELRLERIIEVAELKGEVTVSDVEDFFCISERTARKYLEFLLIQERLMGKLVGEQKHYYKVSN